MWAKLRHTSVGKKSTVNLWYGFLRVFFQPLKIALKLSPKAIFLFDILLFYSIVKGMKKFLLLAGILSIVLLAGGIIKRDTPFELWQAMDKKADTAFQNHEIEEACRYWRIAIKKKDNVKIYNKLGISYLLLKENEKAVDILEKGLRIENSNLGLNYNLSLAYYHSGDNEKALGQLEKVLELNSSYPEANFLKGLCLENIGKMGEAQQAYIEELNSNPGSRRAWKKVKREL